MPSQAKNVGSDLLEGKVGRIYMPKQEVDKMALSKMKGLKRERRQAAADAKAAETAAPGGGGGGGSGSGDATTAATAAAIRSSKRQRLASDSD